MVKDTGNSFGKSAANNCYMNKDEKLFTLLLWIQGLYTVLTALWGLLHIKSFMIVTGPKNDIWLVKTVSVVLLAIGCTFITHAITRNAKSPAIVLGLFTSFGLAVIDFYYATADMISPVYMADGIIETIFGAVWIYMAANLKKH
jgi:hypothetical protein